MYAVAAVGDEVQLLEVDSNAVVRTYRPTAGQSAAAPCPRPAVAGSPAVAPLCFLEPFGVFVVAVPPDRRALGVYGYGAQQCITRWIMPEAISFICASARSRFMVAGADSGNVYLWALSSGDMLRILRGHHKEVTHVAFSDDGQYFGTCSADGSCRVHSVASAARGDRAVATIVSHSLPVTCCAFFRLNPTWIATVALDGTCRIHDTVPSGHAASVVRSIAQWNLGVPLTSLTLLFDDRRIVACGSDGSLSILQIYNRDDSASSARRTESVYGAALRTSVSRDGAPICRIESPHAAGSCTIAAVDDRRFITSCNDANGSVLLWDAASFTVSAELIIAPGHHRIASLAVASRPPPPQGREGGGSGRAWAGGVTPPASLPNLKRVACLVEDVGCTLITRHQLGFDAACDRTLDLHGSEAVSVAAVAVAHGKRSRDDGRTPLPPHCAPQEGQPPSRGEAAYEPSPLLMLANKLMARYQSLSAVNR